jgi:hypothetical protein
MEADHTSNGMNEMMIQGGLKRKAIFTSASTKKGIAWGGEWSDYDTIFTGLSSLPSLRNQPLSSGEVQPAYTYALQPPASKHS